MRGFDLTYNGIQIGVDKTYKDMYFGVMGGTTESKAHFDHGSGRINSYHVGVYTTYKAANDFYIDGIAKYVWMDNTLNTKTGGGYNVEGSGETEGYSIGLETGKRFYKPKSGWQI